MLQSGKFPKLDSNRLKVDQGLAASLRLNAGVRSVKIHLNSEGGSISTADFLVLTG